MPYNIELADKLRAALADIPHVVEQQKMGGVSFMIGGKMCIRAHANHGLMLRCEPSMTEELLARKGAKRLEMKNKPQMNGWLVIDPEGIKTQKDLDFWLHIALGYNSKIKK
ncbi:MAG: TfoX/Sxy family protein [Taibaiella sp.]|nr:TfoX/Sxy family protein [Taibaiella sp.]